MFIDSQAYASAFFGEGCGQVLLDYVNCNGDEASLLITVNMPTPLSVTTALMQEWTAWVHVNKA